MADAAGLPPPQGAQDITGLVLAGGLGQRMGREKGLQPFAGQPLAARALQRLRGQTGAQAINANRELTAYAALGHPVWTDAEPALALGPLAGVLSGLRHATTPWLLTVPCDVPYFPLDLAPRLSAGLCPASTGGAHPIAVVRAWAPDDHDLSAWPQSLPKAPAAPAGRVPRQPVFALLHRSLADDLAQWLAGGGRKVGAWMARHAAVEVEFEAAQTPAWAFANANTLPALQALEQGPGGTEAAA